MDLMAHPGFNSEFYEREIICNETGAKKINEKICIPTHVSKYKRYYELEYLGND